MGMINRYIRLLSSMRTAIGVLIAAAVASIGGTLFEQGLPLTTYTARYGETAAHILNTLGFFNLYTTWWYLGIWAFLITSVSACLLTNGRAIYRQLFTPKHPPISPIGILSVFETEQATRTFLTTQNLSHARTYATGEVLFHTGTLNRLGYFLLHGGIVLLAIAGIISGVFGWRATLNIRVGDTDTTAYQFVGEHIIPRKLPFNVRVESFDVLHYASGVPKAFTSTLSINGVSQTLNVNTPLRAGDYLFYQASFGDGGARTSGTFTPLLAPAPTPVSFTGEVYTTTTTAFDTTFTWLESRPHTVETILPEGWNKGRGETTNLGPSVDLELRQPTTSPVRVRLYQNHPNLIGWADSNNRYTPLYLGLAMNEPHGWFAVAAFMKWRTQNPTATPAQQKSKLQDFIVEDLSATPTPAQEKWKLALNILQAATVLSAMNTPFIFTLTDITERPYTGIMVAYDPGAHLFAAASVITLLGICLMLFFTYTQGWVIHKNNQFHVYIRTTRGAWK